MIQNLEKFRTMRKYARGSSLCFPGWLAALPCLLSLAGCGDDAAPAEAPHGPAGGLIEVNSGSIPLGEDAAAAGRSGAGFAGASSAGGATNSGAAGHPSGTTNGNLPPAKGVSTPCEASDDCAPGLSCHMSPVDYVAHKQCGKYCESDEECTATLGADSSCIGANVCVHQCKSDADCVARTHCNANHWCERSGPGSGVPYCAGTATPCSLLSDVDCYSGRGCRNDAMCSGSPPSCYSQFDSYSCTKIDGCSWSTSGKSCSGSARSCSGYLGELSCEFQQGCHWIGGCNGVPDPCVSQYPSLCEAQPGCYLKTD